MNLAKIALLNEEKKDANKTNEKNIYNFSQTDRQITAINQAVIDAEEALNYKVNLFENLQTRDSKWAMFIFSMIFFLIFYFTVKLQ